VKLCNINRSGPFFLRYTVHTVHRSVVQQRLTFSRMAMQ